MTFLLSFADRGYVMFIPEEPEQADAALLLDTLSAGADYFSEKFEFAGYNVERVENEKGFAWNFYLDGVFVQSARIPQFKRLRLFAEEGWLQRTHARGVLGSLVMTMIQEIVCPAQVCGLNAEAGSGGET